ncbi:hypothetical protein Pcinc_026802 [Petrolisthes cinctipes]|uniref:Oplophorus-luciferin 2-monooxygenase non-catalytic subunit n=1 Tax=Petrolisthes cinctipes TaxID=88211 RepID=A0AAE1K9R5_PETCI|nr:hypothetical protein Pcinc_026802 [Petrolisthes cinctipes]
MERMMHEVFVMLVALSCLFDCGIMATEEIKSYPRDLPCPAADDITPCLCTVLTNGRMEMDCSYVTSNDQLASIFNDAVISMKNFEYFIMDGNNYLNSIRAGDLGVDITFEKIIITSGTLDTVESEAFMYSYDTLMHLEIRYTYLYSFPFSEIARFNQLAVLDLDNNQLFGFPVLGSVTLKYLDLHHNPLGGISPTSLANLPSLEEIFLYETGITHISPGTFTGLPRLYYIHLAGNGLQVLETGTIYLQTSSNSIFLYDNQLTEIEEGALMGLHGILDVSYNLLTDLLEPVFKPLIENNVYFNAAENPLICGCEIEWLCVNPTYTSHLMDAASCPGGELVANLEDSVFISCHKVVNPGFAA